MSRVPDRASFEIAVPTGHGGVGVGMAGGDVDDQSIEQDHRRLLEQRSAELGAAGRGDCDDEIDGGQGAVLAGGDREHCGSGLGRASSPPKAGWLASRSNDFPAKLPSLCHQKRNFAIVKRNLQLLP